MTCVGPIHSSPKEKFTRYIRRMYSRWQIALVPVVSSSGMTYANMVSVPAKKHNIYDIHHHLSPKWRPRV
jgi:hypothetical protein